MITRDKAIEILNGIKRNPDHCLFTISEVIEALAAAGAFTDATGSIDPSGPEDEVPYVTIDGEDWEPVLVAPRGGPGRRHHMSLRELAAVLGALSPAERAAMPSRPVATEAGAFTVGGRARRMTEKCSACGVPRGVLCRRDCARTAAPAEPLTGEEWKALEEAVGARGGFAELAFAKLKRTAPRPLATCSKARAEEILNDLAQPAWLTNEQTFVRVAIEALDRAQFFPDPATLAEIDRLASEILSLREDDLRSATAMSFRLATAVRKLGIGGPTSVPSVACPIPGKVTP